jgi:hypothetical protein
LANEHARKCIDLPEIRDLECVGFLMIVYEDSKIFTFVS